MPVDSKSTLCRLSPVGGRGRSTSHRGGPGESRSKSRQTTISPHPRLLPPFGGRRSLLTFASPEGEGFPASPSGPSASILPTPRGPCDVKMISTIPAEDAQTSKQIHPGASGLHSAACPPSNLPAVPVSTSSVPGSRSNWNDDASRRKG